MNLTDQILDWLKNVTERALRMTDKKWPNENQEFCQQYARAREAQTEAMLEDVLTIADGATPTDRNV